MNMSEIYNRKVRIEGSPDNPDGFFVRVTDAATGESIDNIVSAEIHLHALEVNTAKLTFCKVDENNQFLINKWDGKPIEHTVVTKDPGVSITAQATLLTHPQAIMNIATKALSDINGATESDWPAILANALDDIISRCKDCLGEQGTVGRD